MPSPPTRSVVSNKQIGDRIRLLRKELGLTQTDLAESLNMKQSNISAIERGARGVTVHQVVRLAKVLKCPVDEILTGEKNQKSTGLFRSRRLMRRLQRIEELTENEQRIILQLLDGFVSSRREKLSERAKKHQEAESNVA